MEVVLPIPGVPYGTRKRYSLARSRPTSSYTVERGTHGKNNMRAIAVPCNHFQPLYRLCIADNIVQQDGPILFYPTIPQQGKNMRGPISSSGIGIAGEIEETRRLCVRVSCHRHRSLVLLCLPRLGIANSLGCVVACSARRRRSFALCERSHCSMLCIAEEEWQEVKRRSIKGKDA